MKEIMKNDAVNDTSTRDNDVTTNTTDGTYYNNDYDDTLYGDDETACEFITTAATWGNRAMRVVG